MGRKEMDQSMTRDQLIEVLELLVAGVVKGTEIIRGMETHKWFGNSIVSRNAGLQPHIVMFSWSWELTNLEYVAVYLQLELREMAS